MQAGKHTYFCFFFNDFVFLAELNKNISLQKKKSQSMGWQINPNPNSHFKHAHSTAPHHRAPRHRHRLGGFS